MRWAVRCRLGSQCLGMRCVQGIEDRSRVVTGTCTDGRLNPVGASVLYSDVHVAQDVVRSIRDPELLRQRVVVAAADRPVRVDVSLDGQVADQPDVFQRLRLCIRGHCHECGERRDKHGGHCSEYACGSSGELVHLVSRVGSILMVRCGSAIWWQVVLPMRSFTALTARLR